LIQRIREERGYGIETDGTWSDNDEETETEEEEAQDED